MIVAPKAIQALQLANAAVLVVNAENLHVMREGLIELHKDFKRLLKECEDTSVRHAEELRELKERFGAVAGRAVKHLALTYSYNKGSPWQLEREAIVEGLTAFLLPAPDPLVEAFREMDSKSSGTVSEEGYADRFRAAIEARGGKIVWEAGE